MADFQIPKTFSIFGEAYTVKLKRSLKDEDGGDLWGLHDPDNNTISIVKASKIHNQDQVEQAYFHEVVHAILTHLSYEDLNNNEEFVDRFAKVLHQIIKTSKSE